MSLVVYRLVHPPVTRESGVRLPARETPFLFRIPATERSEPHPEFNHPIISFYSIAPQQIRPPGAYISVAAAGILQQHPGLSEPEHFRQFQSVPVSDRR